MARIRVFDPACGSGNFLVIAYKEMRAIEAEINRRRGESERRSDIPLTNFRGIEIRHFSAEIARLALIIAEYQCDVLYRGERLALAEFLPLEADNWITCGNALRVDWIAICPRSGTGVKLRASDLFSTPLDQAEIDFENAGGETYICGNPQFKGARKQSRAQKEDLSLIFGGHKAYKDCDYVIGWFLKAADFCTSSDATFAFVSTSSVSQGEQVAHLWSRLYKNEFHITFAHQGFKWKNNAANNAGVHCVIIGISKAKQQLARLFNEDTVREVPSISPYLTSGPELYVDAQDRTLYGELGKMVMGSMARDGGHLILSSEEAVDLIRKYPAAKRIVKAFLGSDELIHYRNRYCLWIEESDIESIQAVPSVVERIERVQRFRRRSKAKTTNGYASIPYRFAQRAHSDCRSIVVAATSSENRPYIPADILDSSSVISNAAYAIYGARLWELALIFSKMHIAWVEGICGKLETRLRYSSTLGWNTFPVPTLTAQNKVDLTHCAEEILLAREAHFPATIADLYDPETMPHDLQAAHDRNDETLERIYIGRRFKNDTERLEKLFELYTEMINRKGAAGSTKASKGVRRNKSRGADG
jgi:hypothetical protein